MSKQRYLNLIGEYFPRIKRRRSQLIRRGWDNDVLILDERLVFRFPKRKDFLERFRMEVRFLRAVREKFSVAVPDYAYVPDDLSFGGYHMIPGRPMRRYILRRLAAKARKRIARELAQFLSVLHGLPVARVQVPATEVGGGYFESQANTAQRFRQIKAVVFPKLNDVERDWLNSHYGHYLGLSFNFPLKVVHNDITDSHIYIVPQSGELGGIIDFSDFALSDPAMDFAGLWYFGQQFVEDVLGHYDQEIDADFIERSKIPARVHTAEMMLGILQGTHTHIPRSFDRLRKQLNSDMALFGE